MIVLQIFALLAIYGFIWLLGVAITEYRYRNFGKLNKRNRF